MIHSVTMPSREDLSLYLEIGHYVFLPVLLLIVNRAMKAVDARVDKIAAARDSVVMDHAENILAQHQKHDDQRFSDLTLQVEQRQTVVMNRIDMLTNRIDAVLLRQP